MMTAFQGPDVANQGRGPVNRVLTILALICSIMALQATDASSVAVAGAKTLVIHVDDDAASGGNGSAKAPYANIPEAVSAARASGPGVVISVEPGDYPLVAPLVIDFPLVLRGSSEQVIDPDDPWPTGNVVAGTQTRVFAAAPFGAQAMINVGRTDSTVMSGVTIKGFVFEGTATGFEVQITRVQGYLVADNLFRAPSLFAFQSTASSGELKANHFSGIGTGAIFTGGYPESPSDVVAKGNRMVNNSLGGILLDGASIFILEHGDQLDAVIRGNDMSNNAGTQGFGLRVFILRRDPGSPGDTQSSGNVDALIQDNRIVGNRVGVTLDAGFPYRSTAGVCDPRLFSGTIDIKLQDNTVTGSLVTDALVTFTRSTTALNTAQLPLWQYLHGATFDITDPDGTMANAWIDHPATDPFLGPCSGDATNEVLDNVLIYNSAVIANGRNY
jgi:hypothetical protein